MTNQWLGAGGRADELVRHEIVRIVVGGWTRYFDGLGFAFLLSAVFCGYLFSVGSTPLYVAAIWMGLLTAWSVCAYALRLYYLRDPARFTARRWELIWGVAWFFQGVVWAVLAWWFLEPGNPANNALISIIILGVLVANFYQLGASFVILTSSLLAIGIATWSSFLWHEGEVVDVLSVVFPLFVAFLMSQAWGVAQTTSDSIALRFANAAMAADLDRARIVAERASHAKSEFLANMSHELRTPLNAILGFSEIIENDLLGAQPSSRYGEYAGYIRGAGQHLLSLVTDILDISKIESGQMQVRPETVDAAELARDAAALFKARAQAAEVTLAVEVSTPHLYADRRAAHQILLNLMSNAIKFTPAGGRITLTIRPSGPDVVIAVSDTGCGIPAETLPRLFEPFVQTDNSFARAQGGTGLGLALVRSLARLHGGDARIESVVGAGTSVFVVFPGAQSASQIAA